VGKVVFDHGCMAFEAPKSDEFKHAVGDWIN